MEGKKQNFSLGLPPKPKPMPKHSNEEFVPLDLELTLVSRNIVYQAQDPVQEDIERLKRKMKALEATIKIKCLTIEQLMYKKSFLEGENAILKQSHSEFERRLTYKEAEYKALLQEMERMFQLVKLLNQAKFSPNTNSF